MRIWKIPLFGGGATMLTVFFIILMHIVLHIKCWILIEHISQTTNWILMKFGQGMHNSMMNNRGKFQLNPVHGFQEKWKLVVGDNGHFLENHTLDWAKTYHICFSWCYAFPVQISWGSNAWFVRYPQFKFNILCG